MTKAENTRCAYRATVRAWCIWCGKRALPPLPASSAPTSPRWLAAERRRIAAANTIDLRRAAIRCPHRTASCPALTGDSCVAETASGIHGQAAALGETPRKKVAATAPVPRRLLAPIPDNPKSHVSLLGLRDLAELLVGLAGALQRSKLAAITAA